MVETMAIEDKFIQDINNTQDSEELLEIIDKLPDSYAKGYLNYFMIDIDERGDIQLVKEEVIETVNYLSYEF